MPQYARPNHDELVQHYEQLFRQPKLYELGLLNAQQEPLPRPARFIMDELDPALRRDYRGFSTALPNFIDGCRMLIIGCGSGRDAFVASRLVGPQGWVLALDPWQDNVAAASAQVNAQTQAFGFAQPNIEFRQCLPEELLQAPTIEENSFDIVVVNYYFNLVLDKPSLIQDIFRILKNGGELYLGALFGNRRIVGNLLTGNGSVGSIGNSGTGSNNSDSNNNSNSRASKGLTNPVLRGSVYLEDLRRWLKAAGWENFRYIEKRRVVIEDPQQKELLKDHDLIYRIVRAFKLADLEDLCENYGQSIEYLGTIAGNNQFFDLDDRHRFFVDKPARVCGNTCALVQNTRFAPHFRVMGTRSNKHYGLYAYCWYCGLGKVEDDIIEYLEDGKAVCADCSHRGFCAVDGHCEHEE